MSRRLNGIGVKNYTFAAADFSYFPYRLNGADFVVRVHHCNKTGVIANSVFDIIGSNNTIFAYT